MTITDAIREYAEAKSEKLPRYFNGVQQVEVVLEQQPRDGFLAEMRVDVVKHETFVAKASGHDIYECIDLVADKMTRQLHDFKEKLKSTR